MKKTTCFAAIAALTLVPLAGALEIGDPAPELKISKTVKGKAVEGSLKDSGMINVVEFWATWCGPCRQSIPHLTELQEKYKDKNVRIIGISDEAEDKVNGFVKEQGDNMAYTVALDQGKSTWEAYAEPFGVTGIPHAFVVDTEGTLVWHGHPMDGLDKVIDKVLEGKFDMAHMSMQEELGELTMLWAQEYLVLSKYGRDTEGADQLGKKLIESGYEDGNFFGQFAWTLLSSSGLKHQDLEYMLNVAEFANKLAGGESADILDTLAFAQFRNGKVEEAVATQKRAIEICDNDDLMVQLEQRLAQYQSK